MKERHGVKEQFTGPNFSDCMCLLFSNAKHEQQCAEMGGGQEELCPAGDQSTDRQPCELKLN